MCGKNNLKKWQSLVEDLFQNLLEIEETKVTNFVSVFTSHSAYVATNIKSNGAKIDGF